MNYKALIALVLLISFGAAVAQQDAAAPVSPTRAALETAREHVRAGAADEAVAVLEGLVQAGFTAVGVIRNDAELATLAGMPAFDALMADMAARAYPCEHDADFRAFDFWLGEWDVHDGNGNLAGRNVIASDERGCVLTERWVSATGGTGSSINYLDRITGDWVQVWNDASGSQIHIRGGLTEDGMRLAGTIHYIATGTTAPFRGLWTPLADGRVRQFFEQSGDGGESWSPWFEGFYSRAPAAQ